jgi:hypothetical protein
VTEQDVTEQVDQTGPAKRGLVFDITLTHKGGVGKTFIAWLRMQYYLKKKLSPLGLDCDAGNNNFAGFKALGAHVVPLVDPETGRISQRSFDYIINLTEDTDASHMVIDVGTNSYIEVIAYMLDHSIVEFLHEEKHDVRFNVIIAGGPELEDTLGTLSALCEHFPTVPKVIWLNSFHGPIKRNGKTFEEMQIYKECAPQIHSFVRLPKLGTDTELADLTKLLERRQTFGEVSKSSGWDFAQRSRLKRVWEKFEAAMNAGNL